MKFKIFNLRLSKCKQSDNNGNVKFAETKNFTFEYK